MLLQRVLKIFMVAMVGLFGLLGAVHNIIAFESDIASISQVVSGAGAYSVAEWQKIETPFLVWLCWSVIPLGKLATAVLCAMGARQMWISRREDTQSFQRAKYFALTGCGVMLAMLFGIFILIAETWFQQWQTPLGAAILLAAHRYIISIGVLAFYLNIQDQ